MKSKQGKKIDLIPALDDELSESSSDEEASNPTSTGSNTGSKTGSRTSGTSQESSACDEYAEVSESMMRGFGILALSAGNTHVFSIFLCRCDA